MKTQHGMTSAIRKVKLFPQFDEPSITVRWKRDPDALVSARRIIAQYFPIQGPTNNNVARRLLRPEYLLDRGSLPR